MSSLPCIMKKQAYLKLQKEVYNKLKRECIQEETDLLDVEDINCDEEAQRIWNDRLEELGLTRAKIEGKVKISYLVSLLQHATGDYSSKFFAEAGPILETIPEHLDFKTLDTVQNAIMQDILQEVNKLKGTNLLVCILGANSRLKPIITEEMGSRDGEPVLIYYSIEGNASQI